jgi:two-component system, LytTR family, response regulator
MTTRPLRESMTPFPEEPGSSGVSTVRMDGPIPIAGALGPAESPRASPWFLVGERERRLYPVDPHKVDYIESDGNYVTLHVGPRDYIARDTLKRLESLLAPIGFIRIERSLLLNLRAIAYVQPGGRGGFAFTLTSGACLRSSHTFRAAILRSLPLVSSARPQNFAVKAT